MSKHVVARAEQNRSPLTRLSATKWSCAARPNYVATLSCARLLRGQANATMFRRSRLVL